MAGVTPTETAARVGVEAADWRAAVRAACEPLVEAGAVEPRYVDACVALVEEEGPYMVLAPGLALAHARPGDGVRRLCLAVATPVEPVEFGHPDNDPVDLVIVFGSPDSDQHVGLLAALARRLMAGLGDELRAADARRARELLGQVVDGVA
ncbi:MAG: PTS sugar transporter subunit IIA [Acidimicrobiales bacterium]